MNILSLSYDDFKSKVKDLYKRDRFIAASAYRQIFFHGDISFENVKDMKRDPEFLKSLSGDLEFNTGKIVKKVETDGVLKFVTELFDGNRIESVIIPMFTHNTLCVSSQAGCKMGCRFCETAKAGFKRDLLADEITAQLYNAKFLLNYDIRNIVFMGMGEPLDNYENVVKAISVINDERGFDIPLTRITLSTSGIVPGIKKLSENNWAEKINLAVSLNATEDKTRSYLMPVNKRYPLETLISELKKFPLRTKGTVFMEYVLIKGVNDTVEDALRLVEISKMFKTQINLIPYNPGKDSEFQTPGEDAIENFKKILIQDSVFVRRRATKGRDVMAACGQLS